MFYSFVTAENAFAPAFKLAKTQEPLHVDTEHQSQFPFSNTSPGELLRLLQLKQQQNAERQDNQIAQPTVQPAIVLPQLALLQNALQKHQEIVAEQKRATIDMTTFVESRRAEHDALRVLRERLQLDFGSKDGELNKEFFQGKLVCNFYFNLFSFRFARLLQPLSV